MLVQTKLLSITLGLEGTKAINKHTKKGTYFFDYGNAFLLESSRAGADVFAENGIDFKYPSYVQDILGPMCFDYGFGPFRWVCTSGVSDDLDKSDKIAEEVMLEIKETAEADIQLQLADNIKWIQDAKKNKLVVGSQARILYADALGRIKIAQAFNSAIASGHISIKRQMKKSKSLKVTIANLVDDSLLEGLV